MNIDVSIIVPIYNSQQYIDKCINSILNQDFNNFEVILINDGSIDKSSEICELYASNDNRISVIHKENTGSSDSRNIGVELAKGEYICFVDSDDWIENNMISEKYKLAKENKADLVISGMNIDKMDGSRLISTTVNNYKFSIWGTLDKVKENIINLFPNAIINSSCNKLYRSNILKSNKIKFSKTNVGEDTLFNLDVLQHSNSIVVTDKCYYHYMRYKNEKSLTNRTINGSYDGYIKIHERMNQLFNNWNHLNDKVRATINETMFAQYFATSLKILDADNELYPYKLKRKMLNEGLKNKIIINTFNYSKPYSYKDRIFRSSIKNRSYRLSILLLKIKRKIK